MNRQIRVTGEATGRCPGGHTVSKPVNFTVAPDIVGTFATQTTCRRHNEPVTLSADYSTVGL